MQDNAEQPPSLSQLMRESYLAEARAQQRHSEVSRSDASSSRLQIYGSLKGKAEDAVGHGDVPLPDLSAFLSQEELDKSVNLARQAIGHEERGEVKASVAPQLTPSNVSPGWVSSSEPSSVPLGSPSPAPLAAPATAAFTQLEPEYKELPAAQTTFTSDRKMHKASARQENRNSKDEGFNDFNRTARTAPYGLETQSKKEFLNKAADFIEELSSLFKANSSKRVRPRACKTHRSRNQNKSQNDGMVDPFSVDSRERSVLAVEEEEEQERVSPAVSQQPQVQQEPADLQDYRTTEEQQYNPDPQEGEVEAEEAEEAESCALTDTPYPSDPVCEPPHFIQKLKSREVQEGSKVQLDCIVRGLPAPEVR